MSVDENKPVGKTLVVSIKVEQAEVVPRKIHGELKEEKSRGYGDGNLLLLILNNRSVAKLLGNRKDGQISQLDEDRQQEK